MEAQTIEKPCKDLDLFFLSLIQKRIPLEEFPLLEYSPDMIYNILMKLRRYGYIIIVFDYEPKNGSSFMKMEATQKGMNLLMNLS